MAEADLSPDDGRLPTRSGPGPGSFPAGARYSVLRKVLMAPAADGRGPETLSRIERGNGMSPMPQSFREEGREEGMMRADGEVLAVLFASRFDPGTAELLKEAAEAIADPTMLHSATHDAVRSADGTDILRLFGIARNGSAH